MKNKLKIIIAVLFVLLSLIIGFLVFQENSKLNYGFHAYDNRVVPKIKNITSIDTKLTDIKQKILLPQIDLLDPNNRQNIINTIAEVNASKLLRDKKQDELNIKLADLNNAKYSYFDKQNRCITDTSKGYYNFCGDIDTKQFIELTNESGINLNCLTYNSNNKNIIILFYSFDPKSSDKTPNNLSCQIKIKQGEKYYVDFLNRSFEYQSETQNSGNRSGGSRGYPDTGWYIPIESSFDKYNDKYWLKIIN